MNTTDKNDFIKKNNEPMTVLVIIDVQNCFMFHPDKVAGDLNVENKLDSEDIVKELATLVADKTHVVFSRDFHPVNHISLEGYEGRKVDYESIWPKHCRNKNRQCAARNEATDIADTVKPTDTADTADTADTVKPTGTDNNVKNNFVNTDDGTIIKPDTTPPDGEMPWIEIDKLIQEGSENSDKYLEVIGTELSYMFFRSDTFREPVRKLIINNRKGQNKIGLEDTMDEKKKDGTAIGKLDDAQRTIMYGDPLVIENDKKITKYISLTKGERCDKEAYSAFNYHIEYTPGNPYDPINTTKIDNIELNKANSTGLWEWILKNKTSNQITITVCGLVGNVCVMHSLLQGIALWNTVYSKDKENEGVKVKFVYSLMGTRFAPVEPFKDNVKPGFDDKVVKHFNNNRPTGMKEIIITDTNVSNVIDSNIITSFEVLDYLGKPIEKKITFGPPSQGGGGMRRRRRSLRRRGNKSRKLQKRQKGPRTYKNKRRFTKRR